MIAVVAARLGPGGEMIGTTSQGRDLGGEHVIGRRFEPGRVAVVPAAVHSPDAPDDELGLVVDGYEVRPGQTFRVDGDRVDDRVEPGALVHQLEDVGDEPFEHVGYVLEDLTHESGAPDGEAVGREQQLGLARRHVPERSRPLQRIALHLLRVAGVGEHPGDEVAGQHRLEIGDPAQR